jgi:hypothetical protein
MKYEYHLIDSFGRVVSVHPSMDSAIASKYKKLFGHTYTIKKVEVVVK